MFLLCNRQDVSNTRDYVKLFLIIRCCILRFIISKIYLNIHIGAVYNLKIIVRDIKKDNFKLYIFLKNVVNFFLIDSSIKQYKTSDYSQHVSTCTRLSLSKHYINIASSYINAKLVYNTLNFN